LKERSTHRELGYFLGAENRDDFKEEVLVDKAVKDGFASFWEAVAGLEVKAFSCFQE